MSEEAINKVTTIWHNPKLLEAQCESKNTLFVIAKEDTQRIIGLVTGNLIDDKTLNLSRLYIAKEYQRVGIGSLLLNYIMDELPLIEKIQLEVAVGNQDKMFEIEMKVSNMEEYRNISFYHHVLLIKNNDAHK